MTDKDKEPEKEPGQEPAKEPVGQEPTGTQEPKTFSEDYVKELREENAKWRTRLRELEAKESERSEAEKKKEQERLEKQQEWEKLAVERQKEIDTMKAEVQKRDEQIRQSTIRHAIIAEASKQNAASPEDVYQLIDKSQVEIGEDGKVIGHETAVKALLEEKTYLVAQKSPNGVPKTPVPKGKGEITDDERRRRAARTF